MKFLCIECDEAMKLTETRGPDEGSMTVIFGCPKCGRDIAMLTNAMETQMVRALDVKIGGSSVPAEPMAMVKNTLRDQRDDAPPAVHPMPAEQPKSGGGKCPFTGMITAAEEAQQSGMQWTEEAEQRLENIPPMVRAMVRKSIEQQAEEKGYTVIDAAVMDEVKGKIGMMYGG